MSSFQKARAALGRRLRELRLDAGLKQWQLAEAAAWDSAKPSKLENGRQTASRTDLTTWARICGHEDMAADLCAQLDSLESLYVEFRRALRSGMTAQQRTFAEIEAGSTVIRNFENVFIPGLLQTPPYAKYRLAEGVTYDGAPDDLDEAVAARMQRQQILYQTNRRFHFLVTEAALRYRLCPVDVLAGQLDRLAVMATLPTVRFGVIPFDAELPAAPVHGFWIMDERLVIIENFTAELKLTQPGEIAAYTHLFNQFADSARYGSDATRIISRALSDLGKADPASAP